MRPRYISRYCAVACEVLRGERVVLLRAGRRGSRRRPPRRGRRRAARRRGRSRRPRPCESQRAVPFASREVPLPGADHVPALGLRHLDVELDEAAADVRVPEPAAGEVDALLRDDARPSRGSRACTPPSGRRGRSRTSPRTAAAPCRRPRARPRGSASAAPRTVERVDAEEARGVAERRPRSTAGSERGDLQRGVQQELAPSSPGGAVAGPRGSAGRLSVSVDRRASPAPGRA